MKKKIYASAVITVLLLNAVNAFAAVTIKGSVQDSATRRAVEFAVILVPEAKVKAYTDPDGGFTMDLPAAGEYTIMVRSQGYELYQRRIPVSEEMTLDVRMVPVRMRGAAVTITGDRDIQRVSRRTMTVEELKETPASFGDSLNALTSMPGVDRTDGFFGPLVIRSMYPDRNRYYLDGMPLNNPQHFGGIHSVINNSLMSEIDLYASSFPVNYGGPLAAVIEINTVDTVERFSGYTDIGLIASSALIQTPFTGKQSIYDPETGTHTEEEENSGYLIVSARIGYWSIFVPLFYDIVFDEKIDFLPEYYDYQIKMKHYLSSRSSLSMLFAGSKDYWNILIKDKWIDYEKGDDPLFVGVDQKVDETANNLGLYYDYSSGPFRNRLMAYASLSSHYFYMNSDNEDVADWFKDIHLTVNPDIYGIKEEFQYDLIKNRYEIRGGLSATLYNFSTEGRTLLPNTAGWMTGTIDLADPEAFEIVDADMNIRNIELGGYLENRITLGGLRLVPGARFDYLDRTGKTASGYRGLVSYEFPTRTTLSAAGGSYSSFYQTNPMIFRYFPNAARMESEPERAWHSTAAFEQVIGLFTGGAELFYNYFYDLATAYPHEDEQGNEQYGLNSGKMKVYGVELILKKEREENFSGSFGWLSYTYTRSYYRSGLPADFDPDGSRWIRSDFEREHALKLVAGYTLGSHTLSSRFQIYSSFPYTPITGDTGSRPVTVAPGETTDRYAPVYSDRKNTHHFPPDHRLDIRYTYRRPHKWGYVSWYIEVINVYHYKNVQEEIWKYNKPYASSGSDKNPVHKPYDGIHMLPNFGVEVRF